VRFTARLTARLTRFTALRAPDIILRAVRLVADFRAVRFAGRLAADFFAARRLVVFFAAFLPAFFSALLLRLMSDACAREYCWMSSNLPF